MHCVLKLDMLLALCSNYWSILVLKFLEHFDFEFFYYRIVLDVSWGLLNPISQFRLFVE